MAEPEQPKDQSVEQPRHVQRDWFAEWEQADLTPPPTTPESAAPESPAPLKSESPPKEIQKLLFDADVPTTSDQQVPESEVTKKPGLETTETAEFTARATLLGDPLPGTVAAEVFFKTIHSDALFTPLEVHNPPAYEATVGRVLNWFKHLQGRIETQGSLTEDAWRLRGGQSLDNERKEFDKLISLTEQLGPVALLDHVQEKYDSLPGTKNKYVKRMYARNVNRSVLKATESLFNTSDRAFNVRDIREEKARHTLPEKIAAGVIQGPIHPKETALEAILTHSPHLTKGGTVLVLVNDASVKKYLAAKLQKLEAVGSASNSIRSAADRTALSSSENAFETPDQKISVFVLEPAQLKTLAKSATTAYAAMTIVYNCGVNVKTGKPDLTPDQQVDIVTNQAIELTLPGQAIENKVGLLKLFQPEQYQP